MPSHSLPAPPLHPSHRGGYLSGHRWSAATTSQRNGGALSTALTLVCVGLWGGCAVLGSFVGADCGVDPRLSFPMCGLSPSTAELAPPLTTSAYRPAGQMGQVRFVQRAAVEQQLSAGNLVLLTNIGVSSSGELLNCNAFDVSGVARVAGGVGRMWQGSGKAVCMGVALCLCCGEAGEGLAHCRSHLAADLQRGVQSVATCCPLPRRLHPHLCFPSARWPPTRLWSCKQTSCWSSLGGTCVRWTSPTTCPWCAAASIDEGLNPKTLWLWPVAVRMG